MFGLPGPAILAKNDTLHKYMNIFQTIYNNYFTN